MADESYELVNPREDVRKGLALAVGLAVALLITLVIAACGADDEETDATPTPADEGLTGSGTVIVGGFEDAALDPFKDTMIPRFEEETGIEVEFLEDAYDSFFEKAFADGQSGAGQYDVYIMDDPWIPQYAAAGILEDLGPHGVELDEDIMPPFAELAYWPPQEGPRVPGFEDADPALVAMPFVGDLQTLTYRSDVFGDAPATWDELVEQGREFYDRSAQEYGYVFRGVSGNPIVASWMPIFLSYGGEFFDENWEPTFNDERGTAAGEFFVNTLKSIAPPGVVEFDIDQEGASIMGGESAAGLLWAGNAVSAKDSDESDVAGRVDYAIVPEEESSTSQIGIFIAGVSTSAPNKENAVKFLRWWQLQESQIALARARAMPVSRSGFEDDQARSRNPLLPTALAQLDAGAEARPRTTEWGRVEELIGVQLNQALQRGSLDDALDTAAEEVRQYLERQGYYE